MGPLIFEGITGAGKSSTLEALRRVCTCSVVSEDVTFGDFMREFDLDPGVAALGFAQRLNSVLDDVARHAAENVVLERFHFSAIALGADAVVLREVELRCRDLGCTVVIFTLPDVALKSRSLYRREYDGADWQGLCSAYGSEQAALRVLRRAQSRRVDAIRAGLLPYLEVETSDMAWERYAEKIAAWAKWPRRKEAT